MEKKSEPDFYPFHPIDFGWVMRKDKSDSEITSAFRQLIYELLTKDFKEGSIASKMNEEAERMIAARREKSSKAAKKRWEKTFKSRIPLPQWEAFQEFVNDNGLDYEDAHQWWDMTVVDRKGYDRDGNPIMDWRGALVGFCESKKRKRDENQAT